MQSTTAKQSVELREPCRVGGGRIGEIRRIKESKTKRLNDWDAPGLTKIRKPVGV